MTPDQEKALRAVLARALQGRDDSERLFKEERKLTDSLRAALAAAQGALRRRDEAIRWACGEQPLPDGRWFDERAFGLDPDSKLTGRYWWRRFLRLYSGLEDNTSGKPGGEAQAGASDREMRCVGCGKTGRRRWLRPAREGWLYIEVRADDGDAIIEWACSRACAAAQWKEGPGERLDAPAPPEGHPAPEGDRNK
jgi:hypothetical protein